MTSILREDGFHQLKSSDDILEETENTFAIDVHCPNVLVFNSDCKEELTGHELVQDGQLVLQVGECWILMGFQMGEKK